MPNPRGNPGNRGGKKGKSGRKSAYRELIDARREIDLMYAPQNVEELEKRVARKKYSVRDAMLLKELSGSDALISRHFQKVVPDKLELGGNDGKPIEFRWLS